MKKTEKTMLIENQYIFDYHVPENGITIGGSQRYCIDLARLFRKIGYRVFIVGKACKRFEGYLEEGIGILACKAPKGSLGTIDFAQQCYLECIQREADIMCYSDLAIAAIKAYKPSFAIQHGISNDGPGSYIKKSVENSLLIRGVENVNLVICVDTNFINWYRKNRYWKYLLGKLYYINNYADDGIFFNTVNENPNSCTLLFPRRLEEHRGFDIFVNMCEELKAIGFDYKAVFAIDKGNNFKAKQYLSNRNFNYSIENPDFNQIAAYYRKAYLSYIPSKWSEGTSLSAIESICCGTPVLASDVGGLGNIIVQGYNGFLLPPKSTEYTEVTRYLIKNPAVRERMSQNCLSLRETFSKKIWEDKVIKAISRMI